MEYGSGMCSNNKTLALQFIGVPSLVGNGLIVLMFIPRNHSLWIKEARRTSGLVQAGNGNHSRAL